MHRLELPWLDASLLLAPRWHDLAASAQVAAGLLAVLPLLLTVWLYRQELRLVRRSVAVPLLLLRSCALLGLLAVVGLRPVVTRSVTVQLPGRVLVAVDCSASMSTADPQSPLADKQRLAQTLHLSDKLDQLTRLQLAQRLLADEGAGLLQAIGSTHRVEIIGFDRQAWEVPTPAALAVRPAQGQGTDLGLPLRRALEQASADSGPLVAVVVLTDGQHNLGPAPVTQARTLGERRLPLAVVPLGYRQGPPDVAVLAVQAPPAVFKNVEVALTAQVKLTGIPAQDFVVEIHRELPGGKGEPALESLALERLHHDGNDRTYTVPLPVRLAEAGTQQLRVTARLLEEAPPPRTWPNSRRVLPLNVTEDRARVLLVDGEARWEYHYLATALGRDPTLRLDRVLLQQPLLGLLAPADLEKSGHPARALPTEADALTRYDCIVLGDVSPAQLPLAERLRLEKFVADRGGTLILVAGKRFLPLAFLEGEDSDPLRKLLPILQPRVAETRRPRGFAVRLTHEGQQTPYLQLDPAADRSATIWTELPGHFWGVVGRAKPGAVTLATFADPDARPASGAAEEALFARHNYGFGRVVYVGLDSTWRWRYKVGDTYHHRFWGQLLRWAASDKPLAGGNEQVRFGAREPLYREGQDVELVLRLGEQLPPLPAGVPAGLRVLRVAADGTEATPALVPLTVVDGQPRVHEGRLRDLPAGDYRLEPVLPGLADKPRASFRVAPPDSTERLDLSVNLPLLAELAAQSGGRVFPPEEAAALSAWLTQQTATRVTTTEWPLWQAWETLLIILALLTAEWLLRKGVGLP